MNFIKLAAVSVVLSVTTACTSSYDEQNQPAESPKSGLELPEGFNNPKKSEEYQLPNVKSTSDADGDITSPTTVLVIFEGSWIDLEDAHPAKINLEKPDLVDDFAAFIDQGIQSYAKQNNLTIRKNDTGYFVEHLLQQETGFWLLEDIVDVESFTYNIVVDMKSHGRSGSIAIDILNYEKLNAELAPNHAQRYRKEALAAQTLNDLMLELDYIYRVKLLKERASLDITLKLVKNISGNYVISSQQDTKYVWSQIDDIIEDLGFEIDESDEDLHIFDVTYSKNDDSIWQRLFNSDYSGKLDITPGKYEVALTSNTTGVHISFRSSKGIYLTQTEMEALFKLMLELVKEEEAEL